jgi:cysteinyl-tRNA synthetase
VEEKMMLNLFNSLSRKLEEFKPIKEGEVGLYTCGPTVYNYPHIGNYRTYVFEDILRRWLEYRGYKVNHIMNITDVDDKTIRDSHKENVPIKEFTKRYEKAFFEDIKKLGIEPASAYPRATEHIAEMVSMVKRLMEKGYAYKGEDGSTYFSIAKFKGYGKLSHLDISHLKAGARVSHDEYEKHQLADFVLWKAWGEKDGKVFWETELGKGRPGWHIECSAMSVKYLGEHFDIHCGGVDNMFPHHENEIAQSEAASGKKFVNYWLHAEHLMVNGKKMSKSLGNFYTLRDVLEKGHHPKAIRWLLLSTHYRQQLNFTFEALEASAKTVQNLLDLVLKLKCANGRPEYETDRKVEGLISSFVPNFEKHMENDLHVSEALAELFNFVSETNKLLLQNRVSKANALKILESLFSIDKALGIIGEGERLPPDVAKLIEERKEARKKKDWKRADELRNMVKGMGYNVMDNGEDTLVGVSVIKQ